MRVRRVGPRRALGEKIDALVVQVAELKKETAELRLAVSESKLRELVDHVVTMRATEIATLTDHAVKALRLLIDKGIVTQAEANEAIR